MWTYIHKDHLSGYLEKYPMLTEFIDFISLLSMKDSIFLPRLFYKNFPHNNLVMYPGKKQINPQPINITFTGTLREKQVKAVTSLYKTINDPKFLGGIGKMPPGFGKTVISVFIASQLGLKTCVIIDNSQLIKQWIESFTMFSNLTLDDIGLIKQDIMTVEKPVVIASAQSLMSKMKKDFTKIFETIDIARFGLVIFDEVHCTSSSEMFAKTSVLFRTKNILGLSATPFQFGIAEILMKNTIGEVIYETNEYELTPKYYFIYYNSGLAKEPSGWKRKSDQADVTIADRMSRLRDYIKSKSYYNSVIHKSIVYLNLITTYTTNLLKKDHRIIIMCATKIQVQIISKSLTDSGIEHRRFYGEETIIDKDNDKVLVVTYSFCNKGFDMKTLSALILACPLSGKKGIIQVVGRILRTFEGKNEPLVLDLIDLDFPLMFMPEVKRKKNTISEEFNNCQILEYNATGSK